VGARTDTGHPPYGSGRTVLLRDGPGDVLPLSQTSSRAGNRTAIDRHSRGWGSQCSGGVCCESSGDGTLAPGLEVGVIAIGGGAERAHWRKLQNGVAVAGELPPREISMASARRHEGARFGVIVEVRAWRGGELRLLRKTSKLQRRRVVDRSPISLGSGPHTAAV
jgi:hypothetical protein